MSLKDPPDCIILDKWVFEKCLLADEPFAKALRIYETFVSVSNILRGKLVSHYDFQLNLMKDSKLLQFHFYCKFYLNKLSFRKFYI